jgi:PIN domain-containing protein
MTSGPPPASSWAAAPEFYTDENSGTRAVRRLLVRLGYTVHTPAELYGSREAAEGAPDEDWLAKVGDRGWTVIGRDLKIYERPAERQAYLRARVHVFLLPGQALVAEMVHLIEVNLASMCTLASSRQPGTWRLTRTGPEPFEVAGTAETARDRAGQ